MISDSSIPVQATRGAIILLPHPNDDLASFSAVRKARFLVIRRSEQVIAPLKLCFPGGKLEPGESSVEAAIREFREEMGTEIRLLRKVWNHTTPWRANLDWYLARQVEIKNNFSPKQEEVAELFWMDLTSLLHHPDLLISNREFLEKAISGEIDLRIVES